MDERGDIDLESGDKISSATREEPCVTLVVPKAQSSCSASDNPGNMSLAPAVQQVAPPEDIEKPVEAEELHNKAEFQQSAGFVSYAGDVITQSGTTVTEDTTQVKQEENAPAAAREESTDSNESRESRAWGNLA